MAYFKRVTMGHTLVMGRLTWESIGRPLPGRRIVVVSRSLLADLPETVVAAPSPDEGLAVALDTDPDPVVAGGATIYEALLPLVGRVHRTTIAVDVPDADTWFPDLPPTEWQLVTPPARRRRAPHLRRPRRIRIRVPAPRASAGGRGRPRSPGGSWPRRRGRRRRCPGTTRPSRANDMAMRWSS